ncbi:MAG: substrate-binding domain-containing protein, partial [Balneolaceae bacterium]|nr:substrate-binding domain-containing protein [Balneolaceae bacterium]
MNSLKTLLIISLAILTSLFTISCSQESADELIVYSGRSQALVDGLVDQFKEETGADIKVRYGNDAELLAILNEEGDKSPADIFWANTTGALANANENNLLAPLPDSLLQIPASYTSSSGRWLPVTVRFRVLGYNPNNVTVDELPSSVMELPDMEEFEGRVGWTPTYSSFYDFITAMRLE